MKKGKKEEQMLTTAQFADHFQVAYTTVMTWLTRGIVPGARKVDAPRGAVWEIPASALGGFTPPDPGRPRKPASTSKVSTAAPPAEEAPAAKPVRRTGKKGPKK